MICPYCGLDRTAPRPHTEDCVLNTPALTEDEKGQLRAVAFLSRIDPISDREPMMLVNGEPIPLVVAINLDPSRFM